MIFLICSQQVFLMWWNRVLFLSFKACDFLSNLCLQFCEHTDNINTRNLRLAVFPGQLEVKWQIFRNLQLFQEGRKSSFLNYSKTPSTFYFLNHMLINFMLNHQDLLKINCQCEREGFIPIFLQWFITWISDIRNPVWAQHMKGTWKQARQWSLRQTMLNVILQVVPWAMLVLRCVIDSLALVRLFPCFISKCLNIFLDGA